MVRNRAGSHGREWFVVAALAKTLACLKPGSGGVQGFKGRPQIHQHLIEVVDLNDSSNAREFKIQNDLPRRRPDFENYSAPAKAMSRV